MEPKQFLSKLASRAEALLRADPEPRPMMRKIVETAQESHLLHPAAQPRLERPEEFIQDLLVDNPQALEWANFARARVRSPSSISSLEALETAIGVLISRHD